MSAELIAAARIRPPNDCAANQTANDFGVRRFTSTNAHQAHALPGDWAGRYVMLYAHTADVHYAFSKSSSAEVDSTIGGAAAGNSLKVGGLLPSGFVERHRKLPVWDPKVETMYFVRESASNTDVTIELGDPP